MKKIKFGLVGAGWRAEFFLRIASACHERFEVTGVVARKAKRGEALERQWGVSTFRTLDEMLSKTEPQFVVTAVSWEANPLVLRELISSGVPTLSETPPAPDLAGLIKLYELAEGQARIQVAEQYCFQPYHAARITLVAKGTLGKVSQVQVSAGHGYHGISLMRHLLGVQYEKAWIAASEFVSPLVEGPGRGGLPISEHIKNSIQQFFMFDFGDRLGFVDFTSDQYFSWIRNERMLIRGERGEIINQQLTFLKDFRTPIQLDFIRRTIGIDGNLEGSCLKGIQLGEEWVYRNSFAPYSLMDEEIAVATCLVRMDEYIRSGTDFYPLAEACQDHYLYLMCLKALKKNECVETSLQPWASQGAK